MRVGPGVLFAVLLGFAAGCTPAATAPAPSSSLSSPSSSEVAVASAPPWVEPAAYGFTLERGCNRGPSTGRYQVTVQDGKVVRAARVDGRTASGEEEIDVPSLRGLLDLAQTAADDGSEVTLKFDPSDGHPTAVAFDIADEAVDGASCFTISDYRPSA